MYVTADIVDAATLYQGDVVGEFPFFIFENGQPVRRNSNSLFEADTASQGDRSLFVIEAKKQRVMILSQTCDLQRRSNVIICPVYSLPDFITDRTINTDTAKAIRARRINYWFYLPAFQNLPESIADFQTMTYIPRPLMQTYLPKREVTLNDLGRHHLAWSLATYFGRPADN